MKKVNQKFKDDCFKACLASILECDYDDIPNFHDGIKLDDTKEIRIGKFNQNVGDWTENQDFLLLKVGVDSRAIGDGYLINRIYSIICVKLNDEENNNHCVIGYDGHIIHDPDSDETNKGFLNDEIDDLDVVSMIIVLPKNPVEKIRLKKINA